MNTASILRSALLTLFIGILAGSPSFAQDPHLRGTGASTQLIVDGEPYLMLGGEFGNSTASSLDYMQPIWPKLEQMNVNTVLAPVYWELIEPEEGEFNFRLLDGLLEQARAHDMKLVLLWFGSWKNSMSSYVPEWVKRDQERFPRARRPDGTPMEMLSPFYESNMKADAAAFESLMQHLKEVDGEQNTVVMVQVENEIGMYPAPRGHSAAADQAMTEPVPDQLISYLQEHRESLRPSLKEQWAVQGYPTSGTWTEVFGDTPQTEELLTTWHYAHYTDHVASAGEAAYDLPMYVNAALWEPGEQPGEYPSGGPLPHLLDVWRAGAPTIDFLAPDIYFPNYSEWASRYRIARNPLFVPEAKRAGDETTAANALYSFGKHGALGHSPFSIEDAPVDGPLSQAYETLDQLAPLIKEQQGTENMTGVRPPLDYDGTIKQTSQSITMGDYVFNVTFEDPWIPLADQNMKSHGGLIIRTGEDEFFVAGSGVTITFETRTSDAQAGIVRIEEGRFVEGEWQRGRVLNGDQSHQGRHLRLPPGSFGLQKLELYRY